MAQAFNSKESQREFDHYRRKVARLNAYIEDVIKKCDTHDVYLDKSSTIISTPASVWPIEEVATENPEKELVFRQKYIWTEYSSNGIVQKEDIDTIRITWEYDEEADEWYAEYHGGGFDIEDDLRYIKKCVRCGLRFWQSEDPDRLLEQDDDEEGGEA